MDLLMMPKLRGLAAQLFELDAIKFNEYTTRVGLASPFYIDLKILNAYPDVMDKICELLWSLIDNKRGDIYLCGVPYTGLTIVSFISRVQRTPIIIWRNEPESGGTGRVYEGQIDDEAEVVVIQDVITSGTNLIEIVHCLKQQGMKVKQVLAVVDREQSVVKEILALEEIKVRSLFTISELMRYLTEEEILSDDRVKQVKFHVETTKLPLYKNERLITEFANRATKSKNPAAAKLLNLMAEKCTTICLEADLDPNNNEEILHLAEETGPHIAILKIHADTMEDFDEDLMKKLRDIAQRHKFLIMEDRKFADKSSVVWRQCRRGLYHISEWADIVSVHVMVGSCVLEGLKACYNGSLEPRGIVIVAELPSPDALTNRRYTTSAVKMGMNYVDTVTGYMCNRNLFNEPGMVQITTDKNLAGSMEDLSTISKDIVNNGADIVVIGEGITRAKNRLSAVMEYKRELYECYEIRMNGRIDE